MLNPVTDIKLLQNRQRAILLLQNQLNRYNKDNKDNSGNRATNICDESLKDDLLYVKNAENYLLSYYRPETEELKTILTLYIFNLNCLVH